IGGGGVGYFFLAALGAAAAGACAPSASARARVLRRAYPPTITTSFGRSTTGGWFIATRSGAFSLWPGPVDFLFGALARDFLLEAGCLGDGSLAMMSGRRREGG
ncbi:hypothetical protein PMAYCL1PPCAC_13607, partial [Pristionchus mayeri]